MLYIDGGEDGDTRVHFIKDTSIVATDYFNEHIDRRSAIQIIDEQIF